MKLLILRSSFQTDEFVRTEYAELLTLLKEQCGAEVTILGDDDNAVEAWLDSKVVADFVMTATGGVEGLFKKIWQSLDHGIRIIADGRNNSLAAALEILSFVTEYRFVGQIIHGSNTEIVEKVKAILSPLDGTRIGCFGEPSDWLIASDVDRDITSKLGIDIVDIDLDRVKEGFRLADEEEALAVAERYLELSKDAEKVELRDMVDASKVYLALRKICHEERLTAMTIRCFDIVKECSTTSCLALALLNDEGIVAGCEGDLQTVISMVLAQRICGERAFMANPSILKENSSLLAHCTIPLSMCDEYVLDHHFESGIGVAIQGVLPLTDYTLFKWGGSELDRYFVKECKALKWENSQHFCRTQILLDADLRDYLLNHSIGNHHVIIRGRHEEELMHFFKTTLERI